MVSLDALLVVAAIVGVVHMTAPDHWAILSLLGKSLGWSSKTLFGISILTVIGHSLFSVAIGLAILVVGLIQILKKSQHSQKMILKRLVIKAT